MLPLQKLRPGDKVAVLSPSFAGPAVWPHVYELGLKRLRDVFELEPVAYPTTCVQGTASERARDLIAAFKDPVIKAVLASIGGSDQVTYIKKLSSDPFIQNPKPFFGYSDNTHFANHLWLQGVPSYYGGSLLTQFAMQKRMDTMTITYLKHALFDSGEFELTQSPVYNDIGLNWNDPTTLDTERTYEKNEGWVWDGGTNAEGVTWGGCVESVDELLRHGVPIPTLEQFGSVVLMLETSEEIPSPDYVHRVYRALGERGILARVRGVLVGRPKAWEFDKPTTAEEKVKYRKEMFAVTLETLRAYNQEIPIIQNMDFGHTDPQIAMPYGGNVRIDSTQKKIYATF